MKLNDINIIDCHIHFGKFRDIEYKPEAFVKTMRMMGISNWCGMPVFLDVPFDIKKLKKEYLKLLKLAPNEFKPILGIDPLMICNSPELTEFENIPYIAIKIHPYIHHWLPFSDIFENVLNLVRRKNIPLMIHTGGSALSDAGVFYNLCEKNPDITFVLCHGRPVEDAIKIMSATKNTIVDTAFMPNEDLLKLVGNGFEDRILFGTDFPITKHYFKKINDVDWYKNRISELRSILDVSVFNKITKYNFHEIFKFSNS